MGLRVWSGGETFDKKIKTLWGAHKAPPIITKVKEFYGFQDPMNAARGPVGTVDIQSIYLVSLCICEKVREMYEFSGKRKDNL